MILHEALFFTDRVPRLSWWRTLFMRREDREWLEACTRLCRGVSTESLKAGFGHAAMDAMSVRGSIINEEVGLALRVLQKARV